MLTAVSAYSTAASTSPFAINTLDEHTGDSSESQSKLRNILRDQHRRDEHKLQRNHSSNYGGGERQRSGLHHLSSSTTIPNMNSYTSLHSFVGGGGGNLSPSKHYDMHSASSSSNIPSSSNGYFTSMGAGSAATTSAVGTPNPAILGGASMRRGDSADREASSSLSRSHTIGHSDSIYENSSGHLANHQRREPLSRQPTYRMDSQQLSATGDSMPSSADMSRTGSSATMTNGVDIKVVILGSQGVGKTSLVHRYTSGHFSAASVPSTIGASFLTKKLIVDGIKVRLQIWDTAGQERFRSMAPMYYRGSNAAIIVYDITNPSSFEDVKTWIDELRRNVSADLVIHIVGSKLDLAIHSRRVSLDEAREKVHAWSRPQPVQVNILPASPSKQHRSAFGALSRINTLSSISSAAMPTSPSAYSLNPNSRMTSFGGMSTLGSKSSRMVASNLANEEEIYQDADGNSSPSTSSSNGNNNSINAGVSFSPTNPNGEEWDEIEISEVSSKDNEGIEDVFVGIATRLVEKKEEMEALARSKADRNSIYLGQDEEDKNQQAGSQTYTSWCCAT